MLRFIKYLLLLCSIAILLPGWRLPEAYHHRQRDTGDLLLLQRYILQVYQEFYDVDSNTTQAEFDSIRSADRMGVVGADVSYSPDGLLKIFVVEFEGCGAYCNSEWFSWIHFEGEQGLRIKEAELTTVESIHKLPDGKYLVITRSHARPASVLTVDCRSSALISVDRGTIHVRDNGMLAFCQENGVQLDSEPYIAYQPDSALLTYHFGNNYAYSHEMDIDSIVKGSYRYVDGWFEPVDEVITVNDRRTPEQR